MDSAPTDGLRSRLRWVIPALLPLVVAAVFPLAVLGKFQWDDYPLLVDNSAYRGLAWSNLRWMFSTNLMGHYMPVTWMTYGLDYMLWGLDPFGYHLTNLALHAANTTLVYVVALRLFRAVWVRSLVDGADSLRIGAAAHGPSLRGPSSEGRVGGVDNGATRSGLWVFLPAGDSDVPAECRSGVDRCRAVAKILLGGGRHIRACAAVEVHGGHAPGGSPGPRCLSAPASSTWSPRLGDPWTVANLAGEGALRARGGARQRRGVSGAPELCAGDVVGAPRSTGAGCRFRVCARVLPAKDTASAGAISTLRAIPAGASLRLALSP